MAAGLTEDAVVQEDAGHVLAAGCGVDHFLQAFVDHVAVALEREEQLVGAHALGARREGGGTAVECLDQVDVHQAGERRVAADADHTDRLLAQAHLLDSVENLSERERLAAARAEVVLAHQRERGHEVAGLAARPDRGCVGRDDT